MVNPSKPKVLCLLACLLLFTASTPRVKARLGAVQSPQAEVDFSLFVHDDPALTVPPPPLSDRVSKFVLDDPSQVLAPPNTVDQVRPEKFEVEDSNSVALPPFGGNHAFVQSNAAVSAVPPPPFGENTVFSQPGTGSSESSSVVVPPPPLGPAPVEDSVTAILEEKKEETAAAVTSILDEKKEAAVAAVAAILKEKEAAAAKDESPVVLERAGLVVSEEENKATPLEEEKEEKEAAADEESDIVPTHEEKEKLEPAADDESDIVPATNEDVEEDLLRQEKKEAARKGIFRNREKKNVAKASDDEDVILVQPGSPHLDEKKAPRIGGGMIRDRKKRPEKKAAADESV